MNDVPSRQYANVQHGGAKHGARGVDGRDGASGASGRGGITGSNGGPGGDGGTHKLVSFRFLFFANYFVDASTFFYTSLSFFNHCQSTICKFQKMANRGGMERMEPLAKAAIR